MQNSKETKIWNATLYLRLSRDDGDKEESNSIIGQRELLRNFIRTRPELREYAVRIDDGFTGSNFERPSFKKMLEDVKAGRTNCIIVKDLSRFGRNYLDAGEYIEKIFPFLGVRFIAVNDNYDSFGGKNASDELIIPPKKSLLRMIPWASGRHTGVSSQSWWTTRSPTIPAGSGIRVRQNRSGKI